MTLPTLGVILVTFNSADVVLDCLESLLASVGVNLKIVIIDNASTDFTVASLKGWASGVDEYYLDSALPFQMQKISKPVKIEESLLAFNDLRYGHRIFIIESSVNSGFAGGVNLGLKTLMESSEVERFWILNPDSIVLPHTAASFASHAAPSEGFALIGGRVLYFPSEDIIQIDGGTINRFTGVTGNLNQYDAHIVTPAPKIEEVDFITGASMVASREFYELAGPMPEDYFLYYEEVDWALRRGALPLLYCPGGIVYHRAGTSIGSPTLGRSASPFSLYFKHRARMRFMRRYFPRAVFFAYGYSFAKAAQLLLKGYPNEAWTLLSASFGCPPSADIRARLSPDAAKLAFAGKR